MQQLDIIPFGDSVLPFRLHCCALDRACFYLQYAEAAFVICKPAVKAAMRERVFGIFPNVVWLVKYFEFGKVQREKRPQVLFGVNSISYGFLVAYIRESLAACLFLPEC